MIDPNNPIIDARTTVVGNQPSSAAPAGSGGPTPPPQQGAQPTPAPITPAGSSSTTVKTTTSTVPIATTIPEQYTASSYAELIPQLEKRMAEYKPLSEEELKKLRRRQKVEGIISGISDAAQAVSNLIFTHHYAPNMYNPKEGMSAKAKERFEKEKAQREADADKYLQYALTIGKLKDAQEQKEYQRGRDAVADGYRAAAEARARDEADRAKEMFGLNMKLAEGRVTKGEYETEIARIKAEHAEEDANLRTEGLRAGVKAKEASAGASYARAYYYRNGGSGSGRKGPKLQLEDEEPMRFDNETDYDRTVMRLASDYGVPVYTTVVTERSALGKPKKEKRVARPVKDIAADIEREAAKRKNGATGKWGEYAETEGRNNFNDYKVK